MYVCSISSLYNFPFDIFIYRLAFFSVTFSYRELCWMGFIYCCWWIFCFSFSRCKMDYSYILLCGWFFVKKTLVKCCCCCCCLSFFQLRQSLSIIIAGTVAPWNKSRHRYRTTILSTILTVVKILLVKEGKFVAKIFRHCSGYCCCCCCRLFFHIQILSLLPRFWKKLKFFTLESLRHPYNKFHERP